MPSYARQQFKLGRRATAGRRIPFLCLLAFLGILFGVTSGVGAHASLVASSPASGQTAGGLLDHVDLVFDEGVTAVEVELRGPDDESVKVSVLQPASNQLRVTFHEPLRAEGAYRLMYSLVSADEDPLTLALNFRYEADADPALPVVAQAVASRDRSERVQSVLVMAALGSLVVMVSMLARRYIRLRRELGQS